MSRNLIQDEKNFTSSLISALALSEQVPTRDQVREKAYLLAQVFGFTGDIDPVIEEALVAVDTRMGSGVSLIDRMVFHDEEWVFKRQDIVWTYSEAYERYLKSEGWHPNMVQSHSDVSKRILGHLQDPLNQGTWDRRGLVIGHVQSGKTANYLGLIARAADAGYKFIIVIAGIHNNLRKQTQERVDQGFVGRSSDPDNRVPVGVGLDRQFPNPVTLTTIYDDFNSLTARQSGWKLNDFSKPIILVIKKNVCTLDALYKWLRELNANGDSRISDVPMLMIDDEADHASINTNKPELDPTRTNSGIRRIVGLFEKSCYTGYTATPFANIFINPEAYDPEVREELFPRDFIYCLDAPNTYFGPRKVFLNENSEDRHLVPIQDCENFLPFSHKKDDDVPELPMSLYSAFNQFVIVRAVRNLRGHANRHCSMLVNVSRFVNIQNTVRGFLSLYLNKLRQAINANYAMPESTSERDPYMQSLKEIFSREFTGCGYRWEQVKRELYQAVAKIRIFMVNSKSDERLDYTRYERDGDNLTAVAVGGLSLSRGLTIEGLCISYMYRNTRMYDTLMQMGRWFGYRLGYEDLCRIHLSLDSINWYGHIAQASDELIQQIRRMRRDGLSPKDFGLYVLAHPDSLLITASGKMRYGEKITVKQNFSGKIRESYILPQDRELNKQNEMLITEFWKTGFGGCKPDETEKGWIFKNTDIAVIVDFLCRFRTHVSFTENKSAAVSFLERISDDFPSGDVLLLSIRENNENAMDFRLGVQIRKSASRKEDAWRMSKDRVASRGDEKLGLEEDQKNEAMRIAIEDSPDTEPSDVHFRQVRNKPLLMIHVLELTGNAESGDRFPAYGISFPFGNYERTVEVVANPVLINRMHGSILDSPEDEEDFDDEPASTMG